MVHRDTAGFVSVKTHAREQRIFPFYTHGVPDPRAYFFHYDSIFVARRSLVQIKKYKTANFVRMDKGIEKKRVPKLLKKADEMNLAALLKSRGVQGRYDFCVKWI